MALKLPLVALFITRPRALPGPPREEAGSSRFLMFVLTLKLRGTVWAIKPIMLFMSRGLQCIVLLLCIMLTVLTPLSEMGVSESRGRLQGVKGMGTLLTRMAEWSVRCGPRFWTLKPTVRLRSLALPPLGVSMLGTWPSILCTAAVLAPVKLLWWTMLCVLVRLNMLPLCVLFS